MTVYKPTVEERAEIVDLCRRRLCVVELLKNLGDAALTEGNVFLARLFLKEASALSATIDADLARLAAREVVGTDRE